MDEAGGELDLNMLFGLLFYFVLSLCNCIKSVDVFNSLYFYKYNIKNVWTYVVLKMAFHVSVFIVF